MYVLGVYSQTFLLIKLLTQSLEDKALGHKTETCGANTNLLKLFEASSNFVNVLLFKIFGVCVVIHFSRNLENLFSK